MRKIILGKTGLNVTKTAFGALPIQRCSTSEAVKILQKAYEAGINFFDTARAYSDSEQKIGIALSGVRENIIIATKTHATTIDEMKEHIKESLDMLQTDYIDIYQFHNVKNVPKRGNGMYEYMLRLKEQGTIKHIGATAHTYTVAIEVIESGLYETLQYPIFCLSDDKDIGIGKKCLDANIGVIAMKGMGGGLVDDPDTAFAFYEMHENITTIWGVQAKRELDDFIRLDKAPPILDKSIKKKIDEYKAKLGGDFCRGCGYCMSACEQSIQIANCARMSLLCGRSVWENFITDEWQSNMEKINDCTSCGKCVKQCPYSLDIPNLLKKNLKEYYEFLESKSLK